MTLPNPELMVIGDSLAQGCRSLSINRQVCSQSYGSRIAQTRGLRFATPDFVRPVLFDLEQEVRRVDFGLGILEPGVLFAGFTSRLRDNLSEWLSNRRESDAVVFDNLALAGCKVGDLMDTSAKSSDEMIAKLTPNGANSDVLKLDISDLHLAINARFTLNPSQAAAYAEYSPMDWVKVRQPKCLVVHVGHNHGLYSVGGDGKNVSVTQGTFWEDFERLANGVAALPDSIAQIIIILLPKVSSVANLQPIGRERDSEGYAPIYEPVFSVAPSSLTDVELKAIDEKITTINSTLADMFNKAAGSKSSRYHFVSAFQLLQEIDFKDSQDPKRLIAANSAYYSNEYLQGTSVSIPPLPGQGRVGQSVSRVLHGGFQSIDGMHPTGLGYAVLAARIMDVMGWKYDSKALYSQAFDEDSLLSRYPLQLDGITGLLKVVRGFRKFDLFPTSESTLITPKTDSGLVETVSIMKAAIADESYSA